MTEEEISALTHAVGSATNMSYDMGRSAKRAELLIENSEMGEPMTDEERDRLIALAGKMHRQAYALNKHAETIERLLEGKS